ncbi:MFS transporter [Brevibacillus ginsengisoli]|uniref:MFS transporter n=1 Tax=Brevibacillus ginsengisoli TaxID=363854 RepID=UPI003CEC7E8C
MNSIWRIPSFRWYWSGLILSALGDQMGWMGLTWLMMRETHSPAIVGSMVMAYLFPGVIAGLFIGVLLDRWNRRILVIADNLIRGSLLLAIIALVMILHPPAWIVIVLVAVLGMLAPISSAGAQTILPSFVQDKEQLTKANSLMQSQWQLVYLVGPALAGMMIGYFGEVIVLLLDAISFFLCAICFYKMKGIATVNTQQTNPNQRPTQSMWQDLVTGYHYIGKRPILIVLLIITLFFNMAYGPVEVALPFFAKEQLEGSATLLGFLWTALALGALCGSLWFSVKTWKYPIGTSLAVIILLWGLTTLPLAIWPSFHVGVVSMFVAGVAFAPYNVLYLSYLQKGTPDHLLGRVLTSARTITGVGMPLGAFLSGQLIQFLGVMNLLLVSSLACLIVGLLALQPLQKLR